MLLIILAIVLSSLATLFFSTLTYALRDFSRARLGDRLESAGKGKWLEPTLKRKDDLIFVTAVGRMLCNMLVLLFVFQAFEGRESLVQYAASFAITGAISLLVSVAIPHALAAHMGEACIAFFVSHLHFLRMIFTPVTRLMHGIDSVVRKMLGKQDGAPTDDIEQEIVSVVEEGVKEGVVDEQEKEMIESVIEFRDTLVGHIMTARPEIVAIESGATLVQVQHTLEESGYSRLPVYEGTLDHISGILYARDLLKYVGKSGGDGFSIAAAMRPAIFVPETKPLRDLLQEFRARQVHIAIVLDEYGGTAGVATVEDILEELVGEISDEHESAAPSMIRKIDENTFEIDARLEIDEANRELKLEVPADDGTATVGGFVAIALGKIPAKGASLTHGRFRYTVLEAEPHRVMRLKIEKLSG